jgi:transposase-like protein
MSKTAIEVITSVRRRWRAAEKERLVAASLAPGAGVSAVARQAGIHPGQLYDWMDGAGSCAPARSQEQHALCRRPQLHERSRVQILRTRNALRLFSRIQRLTCRNQPSLSMARAFLSRYSAGKRPRT